MYLYVFVVSAPFSGLHLFLFFFPLPFSLHVMYYTHDCSSTYVYLKQLEGNVKMNDYKLCSEANVYTQLVHMTTLVIYLFPACRCYEVINKDGCSM